MKIPFQFLVVLASALICLSAAESGNDNTEPQIDFSIHIKPLLERSCLGCHGQEKPKGRFRVDSREAILRGGASGDAAIAPGSGQTSPLIHYISDLVEEMEMPPLGKRDRYPRLSSKEIELVRKWIDEGATWPDGIALTEASGLSKGGAAEEVPGGIDSLQELFAQIRRGDSLAATASLETRIHARDKSETTPLMQAAFYLNASMLKAFLDAGAGVNATNSAGRTALMSAVHDLETVRILLKHGANPNAATSQGNTALIIAARQHGSSPVLRELLAAGANVNAANHQAIHSLYAAAETGDVEAIRTLIDAGADVNLPGRLAGHSGLVTPLMAAARHGHLDVVKLLLAHGANLHFRSEYGNALNFAANTDRHAIARLLIEKGAAVDLPGRRIGSARNDSGLTPLIYAAMSERNDASLVQLLIDSDASINAKASSGETALSVAELRGRTQIVAALRNAGAAHSELPLDEPKHRPLWSEDQIEQRNNRLLRDAAQRGLSLLLQSGRRLTEATANRCFTCHQQSQPALALHVARATATPYDQAVAAAQLDAILERMKGSIETALQQPLPVPSVPAWLLVGLDASGVPASEVTDAFAWSLARSQNREGQWRTFTARAPTDYSDVTSTALAIRALRVYAPPTMKKDFERRISRAAAWLRDYEPYSSEERAYQLLGLRWAGSPPAEVEALAKTLLGEQHGDGGWAQLPTLESDAYATGLALFSLTEGATISSGSPAYQKGIKFLLRRQLNDGSWFVRSRASPVQIAIDGIFAHGEHQWISSVATTWSTIALMRGAALED